jgi:hypothetical protein
MFDVYFYAELIDDGFNPPTEAEAAPTIPVPLDIAFVYVLKVSVFFRPDPLD